MTKIEDHKMFELQQQIRMFRGWKPYDGPENSVRGDGYFLGSLFKIYGRDTVLTKIQEMEKENETN